MDMPTFTPSPQPRLSAYEQMDTLQTNKVNRKLKDIRRELRDLNRLVRLACLMQLKSSNAQEGVLGLNYDAILRGEMQRKHGRKKLKGTIFDDLEGWL